MIQLFDVSKRFGGIHALHHVTLHIQRGEFVLLTGPSGAGKSTLLRTVFAGERPDEGQVILAGRNITRLKPSTIPFLRRAIGVVFQDFKLLDDRTALENVAIALEIRGLRPQDIVKRSLDVLKIVGLSNRSNARVKVLSGGEQQRVAIARAVVGDPPILLADEPTGNLDPERSHDILDLLDRISRQGTTVILATHDPMVLQNAAFTRAILLDAGKLVGIQSGSRFPITPPHAADSAALAPLAPAEVAA